MGTRAQWALVGRCVAGIVAAAAALICAALAFLLLGSLLSGPGTDPHGYVLIFGSMMLVPTTIVGAAALPFVVPRHHRRAHLIALCGSLAWIVGTLVLVGFALSG